MTKDSSGWGARNFQLLEAYSSPPRVLASVAWGFTLWDWQREGGFQLIFLVMNTLVVQLYGLRRSW